MTSSLNRIITDLRTSRHTIKNRYKKYTAEARELKSKHPESYHPLHLARLFPLWYSRQDKKHTPVTDESPWITFGARAFLDRYLTKEMSVFEFGSGGSTLYLLKRAGLVVSVEHDPAWGKLVSEIVAKKGYKNWESYLLPPTTPNPQSSNYQDPHTYSATGKQYENYSFKEYATVIEKYADHYFDLVIIDGRARPSCFIHGVNKVKPGGMLLLDNAEREHYGYIHQKLKDLNWTKYDFFGPGPYNAYFWQTCLWCKPPEASNERLN